MKVLGISFGRKNGNCDILVKQALLGAIKTGAEVSFMNTCNLKIDRCTGCGACDKVRDRGGMSLCVLKDDFLFVREAIMDADALMVAAPVYSVGPTGQYKNLVDRMGASHDRAALLKENQRRRSLGWSEDKMLDPRVFKNRPFAVISVGGARTEGWTSLGLPNLHLLGFSNQMIPVDHINAYGMGDRVNPAFDEKFMSRLFKLGENVAGAAGMPEEQIEWKGDDAGMCPTCHCRHLFIKSGTEVECAVCGSAGTLRIDGGEIKVDYTEEEIKRSRYHMGGLLEHQEEISDMMVNVSKVLAKRGGELEQLLSPLKDIPEIKPTKL